MSAGGCQRLIADDGRALCDGCTEEALQAYISLKERTPPNNGTCRNCGRARYGRDPTGLCYRCWRYLK